MTRQSKTKLLKIVCKQAELMRAPYRGSSSASNKIIQTDKKSLRLNQTQMNHCQIYSNNANDIYVNK
jgi:hypothetical protein